MKREIFANFRGVASVRRGKEHLLRLAQGMRKWSDGVPNTMDTCFATASAGKAFVAVGILQLIEQGRLSMADTLRRIPIDWKRIDRDITVHELLTHTSGIPDYFDESVMDEYEALWVDFPCYRVRKSADLLPLFIDKPMLYPHGTRFQYNNTGFVVLGMMIEAVTGESFDSYLEKHVFQPAGMARTGYYEMDRLPEGCADSYIFDTATGEFRTNIFSVDAKGTGAGGAFTTASDMEKFWDALLSFQLLSAETTERMLSEQVHSAHADSYGLGVWIKKAENRLIPYFTGSDPGVSFISLFDRTRGENITLLSNYGDNVWALGDNILRALWEAK